MEVDIETLETLNLLTRDGARQASDALAELADAKTTIDITKVKVADRHDIAATIQHGEKDGVQFEIAGELSGTLLFTFDEAAIEKVTDLLVPGDASASMERSSVTELANIMMGGFLTGWGDHLETGLDASPPGYLESTELDGFEVESIGPETNSALAFESTVTWRDNTIGIDIFLVPDRNSIENVLEAEAARESETADPFDGAGDEAAGETTATADDGAGAFGLGGSGTDGTDSADESGSDSTERAEGDEGTGAFGFGGAASENGHENDDENDDVPAPDAGTFDFDDEKRGGTVSLDKLSIFSDLTKEGTETAAERVTAMTGIETSIEIAGISFTPIEDIPEMLGDTEYVGTTGEFEGTPSGYLVVLFDESSARNIAEAMLPMEPDADGLTAMHESAIEELGNIMTSGFIDGWANVLQTSVEHTPPEFVDDIEMAFMEIIGDQLGLFQTHAFSIESAIMTEEVAFDCRIHALPNESELEEALDALLVERRDQTAADPDELF